MKQSLIILLLLLLGSCKEQPKTDDGVPYNPQDYFSTQKVTVYEPPIDTTKVLMKASDTKGSWTCEIYVNHLYVITRNYKDTFRTTCDFSYAVKNNLTLNPVDITSIDKSFSMSVLPETCTGETDNAAVFSNAPKKIVITVKSKKYKGCIMKVDSVAAK